MADMNTQKNIGALIEEISSIFPVVSAAATLNGVSIDRVAHSMAQSCELHTGVGASAGAPTTLSVTTKIQDSADNSTWADYKYDGTNVATGAAITTVNTDQNVSVDLTLARRYVRAVSTIAFTGGSSPTVAVAVALALGGENTLAAV